MKKFFVFALCMLAVSINYSCGDEEEPVPGPGPQTQDISYYSYDVKYNADVQLFLDLLNVKFNLYDGVELPAAKKSMVVDCALKDSVLTDINKPYYVGVGMECGPIEGLEGATVMDFLSAQKFQESVLPYLKEELAKKGVDLKKLNIVADFVWHAEMVDEKSIYSSSNNIHLASSYDAFKAISDKDTSDEEICNQVLKSVRNLFYETRYVNHWNPQIKRFEHE